MQKENMEKDLVCFEGIFDALLGLNSKMLKTAHPTYGKMRLWAPFNGSLSCWRRDNLSAVCVHEWFEVDRRFSPA